MNIRYIASGDYHVVSHEPLLLKALLGSCVGVAIFDPLARVGGMIHLLLPEPPTPDSSWAPCSHASTGLPIFIDALLAAGAAAERLQAVVAGGALFGGISEQDLALNIGGRCVDRVHAILKEHRIPILQEESCGLASSILTLDTSTWDWTITSHFEPPPTTVPPQGPSREEIEAALAAVPPIPQTAATLIGLLAEDSYDTAQVIGLIETDQVLAAKALSLCNSAFFGLTQPVESIDKAVVLLGEGHLLTLMVTAALEPLLSSPQAGYALQKGGLYKHALAVAYAARALAQYGGLDLKPGLAYAAGLLHDIGKVGLDHYFAACRPLFYQGQHPLGDRLVQLERQLLGLDHQEAGLRLANLWDLPKSLVAVIAFHHQPEASPDHQTLLSVVALADHLASRYLTGVVVQHTSPALLSAYRHLPALTPAGLDPIIAAIPWKDIMYL